MFTKFRRDLGLVLFGLVLFVTGKFVTSDNVQFVFDNKLIIGALVALAALTYVVYRLLANISPETQTTRIGVALGITLVGSVLLQSAISAVKDDNINVVGLVLLVVFVSVVVALRTVIVSSDEKFQAIANWLSAKLNSESAPVAPKASRNTTKRVPAKKTAAKKAPATRKRASSKKSTAKSNGTAPQAKPQDNTVYDDEPAFNDDSQSNKSNGVKRTQTVSQ